jgi:hypothetical protein
MQMGHSLLHYSPSIRTISEERGYNLTEMNSQEYREAMPENAILPCPPSVT